MTVLGLDVSHHQGGNPDFTRAANEGIEFVFIKATEGATFVDPRFAENLAKVQRAGLSVAAYHYVRDNASAAAQVAHIRRVVPLNIPVIPDVEANSGMIGPVRTFVGMLMQAGYRVPLLYLPRWYWQQIGSPDLRGLPSLWSSRYPDNTIGDLRDELARVPVSYWNGYGGQSVTVLQFTSSARVAGYAPLDANAFLGTRGELDALLYDASVPKGMTMKDKLAKTSTDPQIWFGDGMIRRKVANATDLADLKFWMQKEGLDITVQAIDNLTVLGEELPPVATVELDYNRFVNDVINGLAAKLELGFVPVIPPDAV